MIDFDKELQEDEKKSGYLRMKELKASGKKVVGVFCTFTPLELIDAAGAVHVSLCGSSEEGIADAERVYYRIHCAH